MDLTAHSLYIPLSTTKQRVFSTHYIDLEPNVTYSLFAIEKTDFSGSDDPSIRLYFVNGSGEAVTGQSFRHYMECYSDQGPEILAEQQGRCWVSG